jgi:hypothetical protein
MENFEQLKKELLDKAKEKGACIDEYKRALKADSESELLKVIFYNLRWCVDNEIVSHEYFARFNAKNYLESGIANTGKDNSGYSNSGHSNSGHYNSGDSNSGHRNSGDSNSGDSNSGHYNSGDSNSGNYNSGHSNSGHRNSGHYNSGDYNSGNYNSGSFCTDKNPVIWLFDKPTNMRASDWNSHIVHSIINSNFTLTKWVILEEMTESEIKENPNAKTTKGVLKTYSYKEAWKNLWDKISESEKQVFLDLPNFDADKFEEITGIKTK